MMKAPKSSNWLQKSKEQDAFRAAEDLGSRFTASEGHMYNYPRPSVIDNDLCRGDWLITVKRKFAHVSIELKMAHFLL